MYIFYIEGRSVGRKTIDLRVVLGVNGGGSWEMSGRDNGKALQCVLCCPVKFGTLAAYYCK